jgi:hypothetical protein
LNDKAPLSSIEPADENVVGAPDWAKIEVEYRAGKPLRAISAQFGVGKNAISRKAKEEGWQKSGTTPGQDAGQMPEKSGTSDVVPPPSQDDETFDWNADDIVVLHEGYGEKTTGRGRVTRLSLLPRNTSRALWRS